LQYFLRETMHSLAAEMAQPLRDSIRLGEPVTHIVRGVDGVTVGRRAGSSLHGTSSSPFRP